MRRGNTKFTARVKGAIQTLAADPSLGLVEIRSNSLFSPVFRDGDFEWIKVMDTDGLLVGPRRVREGEGAAPIRDTELMIGVVVQSEDLTSQTKPNPLGKASIGHIANGIWVDVQREGRKRLDILKILMLLPEGTAPHHQESFNTAKRNVENAAAMMPGCEALAVRRGIGSEELTDEIRRTVRRWFAGRGRPRTGA